MAQANEQQQGQQQQLSPTQRLGRALTGVRKVQNLLELQYPGQGEAIKILREAGDLVWAEIERMQQQAQQQSKVSNGPGTRRLAGQRAREVR